MANPNQHPSAGLVDATLQNLKNLVDVNTIIGDTIQLPDGTTRLWWKVSKTTLSVAEPDAPACLSALPESIMALVDHK